MNSNTPSFLLIFRDRCPDCYQAISPEERQQLVEQWNDWYDTLSIQGKVRHGHPLEPGGRVISGRDGRVTDGPYTEAKEAIGGYFMLTVADLDEATEIARRCPSLALGMTVEVRAIADVCAALGVRGKPELRREAFAL
jgi:hypothetical protein